MRRNLTIGGIAALVLAALCWAAETAFYGYVDAEGVLRESLVLPLTFVFAALGIALLAASRVVRPRA